MNSTPIAPILPNTAALSAGLTASRLTSASIAVLSFVRVSGAFTALISAEQHTWSESTPPHSRMDFHSLETAHGSLLNSERGEAQYSCGMDMFASTAKRRDSRFMPITSLLGQIIRLSGLTSTTASRFALHVTARFTAKTSATDAPNYAPAAARSPRDVVKMAGACLALSRTGTRRDVLAQYRLLPRKRLPPH
jgi:hypothetical protein